jgi:DNA-binding transcriptional LysR family regulator
MDRLTSLTVFARVVEAGGFSAAARRLNMSTTMVSNHVATLEEYLGARLLNRTTRKVSLTEVGKAYYERTTQILADIEDADRIAHSLQSTPRGTLRLYAGSALVRFISPIITDYLATYPDVTIDMHFGERPVDMIEEGYDLAIRTSLPPDSSLISRHLAGWRHVLVCSPGYLETYEAPRHPGDLARHNCLRYPFYPFGDDWRFTGPDGVTVTGRANGNLLANSAETLRQACLAGTGLFLAPSFVVGEDVRAGRVVRLMEDYKPVEFAINAVYPHRLHLSSKVRSFIDLLADGFSRLRHAMNS